MACDIKTAKAFLEESLANLYEKRELKSIVKYYFEDKFTNKEVLNDQDEQIFFEDIALLKNHCPLQLIVGKAYFYDRFYKVNAHTLIPRPETEELVSLILETIKTAGALNLLDIGTGTGCIPISLRAHGNFDKILGIDISAEALVVAKENTTRYDLDVDFQQIDFLDQNQWKKIDTPDIIVSNPPY
ncbi:MAG TPA: HemK family protein methyltransferase, partial [Saprospiraceae bacterium]|nr:HemK family protein methyltransferase [Saprospiraceae bacterium]